MIQIVSEGSSGANRLPPLEDGENEYQLSLHLTDGTQMRACPFRTRRVPGSGDFVNLPVGPDGRGIPGPGFVWRVRAAEDGGQTLILDYEMPHTRD
jgi:hypothetical protein